MQSSPPRVRRASAVVLVVGLLLVLGLLLNRLSTRTTHQAVLTRTMEVDAEHQGLAEGVLQGVLARLKKRPWAVRFYSQGGYGSGAYSSFQEGTYRDGQYKLWVQDVQLGSTEAVPGLVDLFIRLVFQEMTRQFHLRVSLLPRSVRSDQRLEVIYFARTGEPLDLDAGRVRAAQSATEALVEGEDGRIESQAVLEQVATGGSSAQAADALAGQSLGDDTAERAEDLKKIENDLVKGIHLMGEDGAGLQRLLPPLQRSRFLRRGADHGASQSLLRQVIDSVKATVLQTLLARIALARSIFAQAWKEGPASDRGRQLLDRAWTVLQGASDLLKSVDPEIRAELSPTLRASIFIEMARVAVAAGWSDRENQALEGAEIQAEGTPLFGGREDLDEVLSSTLSPLRSVEGRARLRSSDPLRDSGFTPVTMAEVDGFVQESETGWTSWPADSGKDAGFWQDLWESQILREGENGTLEDSGNIDRNGDGIEDEDTILGETEENGEPVDFGPGSTLGGPLVQTTERSIWDCEGKHPDPEAAETCIREKLKDFLAGGGEDFHIHKLTGPGGKVVHAKVKKGEIKHSDVGGKPKINSAWPIPPPPLFPGAPLPPPPPLLDPHDKDH